MFDIKVAFILLVGGKGKRFTGNVQKGLIKIENSPIIIHQLETLKYFTNPIYLVARDNSQINEYKGVISDGYVLKYVVDDTSLFNETKIRSPLIGIYSAFLELKKTAIKYAFVISCDMPFIKREVISVIIKNSRNFDVTVPRWQNGYLEPLFAVYNPQTVVLPLTENIKNHKFKLSDLIAKCSKVKYIEIENNIKPLDPKLQTFVNINKPNDLKRFS